MIRALLLALCLAAPAAAQDRAALAAVMEAAGAHETRLERHALQVSDCTLTTFRWRLDHGPAPALWSSFTFDIGLVRLTGREADGFVLPVLGAGLDGSDMVLVHFTAPDSAPARFERHIDRPPIKDRPITYSDRGDGTGHYVQTSTAFFYRHEGVGVIAKGQRFAAAYRAYADAFCRRLG